MTFDVSAVPTSAIPQSAPNYFERPTSNYHPTIWGDHFLCNAFQTKTDDGSIEQEYEKMKGEVKGMLMDATLKPCQKLRLVDAIQRLGVGYHFEIEIEEILSNHISHDSTNNEEDLYTASLRFRLLRQQGIKISCDIFQKFKDENGEFRASLRVDVPGMLSLYEATFLGLRGEAILDEALSFTTKHLQAGLDHLTPFLKEQVNRALNRPIRKWLTRLEARHYLTFYEREESHNKTVLKFAKLDFNILQGLHRKELFGITEWWRSLNVTTNFPYARDRIVECFFWISGVYFEPKYCHGRKILTKIIAVTSILDDTYDNYATFEELELFTEAIRRWDIKEVYKLPEYMQKIYRILIDVYAEFEEETAQYGRSFCVYYAKEAMKQLLESYLYEAKWRDEGYVPTLEEYLQISLISGAYQMLATSSFLGMGKVATKEAFEWVSHEPKIVKAASVVCRLMDDIVSHKFEQGRDHVASGIECYMKQHNVSEEEVIEFFRKEVELAWKDINEEFLRPTPVPMPLLDRVLNLARVIDVIYKDDDGYTNSHVLKDHVSSLLNDPVY